MKIGVSSASAQFAAILERDVSLARLTSFKIGGIARRLYLPIDSGQATRLIASLGGECRILGGGTNVLVASDVVERPIIIMPLDRKWKILRGNAEKISMEAPAAMPLRTLVSESAARGLAGLETLAGIPGTVGGATVMNAGGRHGCIGERIEAVDVIENGRERRLNAAELEFSYRQSSLRGRAVKSVILSLEPSDTAEVTARLNEILAEKKVAQPLGERSAGCVFKNPPGRCAWELIDEAGMRGAARGGARVSDKHANFIVNDGSATAEDVLSLIETIRRKVEGIFGLALETEIEIW